MSPDANQVVDAATVHETEMIVEDRWGRSEDWGTRIQKDLEALELYEGEWDVLMPDQASLTIDGKTRKKVINSQNIPHDATRDLKNLIAETVPSFTARPKPMKDEANSDLQKKRAGMRSQIAKHYRDMGTTEPLDELLAEDLVIYGRCFVWVYPEVEEYDGLRSEAYGDRFDYPQFMRLQPLGAFPTWFRNDLLDVLYVEEMPLLQARRMAPEWYKATYDPSKCGRAELIYYWNDEKCCKVLSWTSTDGKKAYGTPHPITVVPNDLGKVPVAWAAEFGPGGKFEGMLDQAAPAMAHRNRLLTIITDGADRATYGPLIAPEGTDVSERGPDGVIFTPVGVEGTYPPQVAAPARMDQSVFWLAQDLEKSVRGTLIYPQARAGSATQSIISAAGVNAFQGERNSGVLWAQRHLTRLWTDVIGLAFATDEKFLNFEKDMGDAIGNTSVYLPAQIIDGQHTIKVTYGGMGVDKINDATNKIMLTNTGLVSKRWARRQLSDVDNPIDQEREIALERGMDVWYAQTLQSLPPEAQRIFFKYMADGKDEFEAIDAMEKELQGLPAPGAPSQPPGPQPQPVSAQEQQLALEKGATEVPPGGGAPALPDPSLLSPGVFGPSQSAQTIIK